MEAMSRKSPAWLKPATDFGPLAVFFVVYLSTDLMMATAAIMVATLVSLAVTWVYERRIAPMPLIAAAVIGIFGGLTLWLQDETFFKMKPTIVQAIFAVVLLSGLAFNRPLLRPLMGTAWPMDEIGWRKLTFRFGLFFAAMALLNEAVWRTQSTDFWVTFKVFGIMGLTLLFMMTQVFLMQRHHLPDDSAAEAEGKDGTS